MIHSSSIQLDEFRSNESHDSIIELYSRCDKLKLTNDIHIVPLKSVYQRLSVTDSHTGLTEQQVISKQEEYGSNKLTQPPQPGYIKLFIQQAFIGFNGILWIAGIFAFLAYKPFGEPDPDVTNLGLGIVLLLVIILNAVLNVYQEMKSLKIISSFTKISPTLAIVRRQNIEQQIHAELLVPGDIILLKIGDKVPADCRILTCDSLKVNNSELTGESKPVACTVKCSSLNYMESTNILFYSSSVVQGRGEAIVTAIGDKTVLGNVSKLTRSGSKNDEITGLHREVNRFVLFVVGVTVIAIITIWITWIFWLKIYHKEFLSANQVIVNSIGMTVGFLPMGLPAAVTLVLTIVAKRMYKQKVLVKSLQTVETFNSTSIICTDKTGTLTLNKMSVAHLLWDINGEYKVRETTAETLDQNAKLSTFGSIAKRFSAIRRSMSMSDQSQSLPPTAKKSQYSLLNQIQPVVLQDLLVGACLCNDAEKQMKDNEMQLVGDAADLALYSLGADKFSLDVEHIKTTNKRLNGLPFNSTNKFMITANRLGDSTPGENAQVLITMKGAPDIVAERCWTYKSNDGHIKELNDDIRQQISFRQEQLGKSGYRVIALLQQIKSKSEYEQLMQDYNELRLNSVKTEEHEDLCGLPGNGYCFIGLFSLLDPPRPEVPDAVLKARQAKIRIAMVTGDHSTTAVSTAKTVNILSEEISVQNGLDSFKFSGSNGVQLFRNDSLLTTHTLGKITKLDFGFSKKKSKVVLITDGGDKQERHLIKQWWRNITMYFSEPVATKSRDKQVLIPYGVVVQGSNIPLMDDYLWDWVLSHQELVFARTSPEQKLRIVMECQRRGEIVAVTGDGTNDAPGLKRADLGVSMQSGTDVSKEAGDMILLDNDFSSIIQAIETGRLLSDNLKKVAIYLLPGGSWSEIWPVFFNVWLGIPLALSAFQATVFCMLNDVFMSLAMVSEKAESDIMRRPPVIRTKSHLLNLKLLFHAYIIIGNIECFAAFFCYFWYYTSQNIPLSSIFFKYETFESLQLHKTKDELTKINQTGQCIYYVALCIMQLFNLLTTRTRYASFFSHNPFYGKGQNLWILLSMLLSIGTCILITQVPWSQKIFKTEQVPLIYVLPALAFGTGLFLLDELRKLYIRRNPKCLLERIAW